MKTKELLELLSKADPEEKVIFWIDDGCCGDFLELDLYDVELYDIKPVNAVLRFNALPGYKSCIQSGGTKRADKEYWKNK